MTYLSISILFFLSSIIIFFVFRKQSREIAYLARNVAKDYWLKTKIRNEKKINLYIQLSYLRKKQRLILSIFFSLSLIFLIIFLIVWQASKSVHSMRISYESLGVYRLGKNLTTHFSNLSVKTPIATMLITPNSENIYVTELITQLYEALDSDLFEISVEYSVDAPEVRLMNYELSSSHLEELLSENVEVQLVITLAGFVLDSCSELQEDGGPFIAVFSEKAELNDYLTLINRGMIDLAIVSKATFDSHNIIPAHEDLNSIFNENYLIINTTNVAQIIKDYKQTISKNTKKE